MSKIAFIGLGEMGSRMALRLVRAGHDVSVWNRTAAKMEPLVRLGATASESPAAASRDAEFVITMVADPAALREITSGDSGIASGVPASATVIEMSTVGPAAIEWLDSALPQETGVVDAPVLGSLSEAEAGQLLVFVGASEARFEDVRAVVEPMGTPLRAGPRGSGAAAKLVANLTLFGTLGVLGEALALADGLGLRREVAFEVLSSTPVGDQAERRRVAIQTGDYPKRFDLSLARKDADLVTDAAQHAGVDLRVIEAARSWLVDAEGAGRGDEDYSAVLSHILDRSGR